MSRVVQAVLTFQTEPGSLVVNMIRVTDLAATARGASHHRPAKSGAPGIMIAAGKAVGGAVGRTLSRGKSKKEEEDRAAAMLQKVARGRQCRKVQQQAEVAEMEHKIEDALKSANGASKQPTPSIASALALVPVSYTHLTLPTILLV